MGRSSKERRKPTNVSQEREQKKIRENILQVLKARSSSPGQGGALLVGEPKPDSSKKHKHRRRHRVLPASSSTDDSAASARSMSGRGRKRTQSVSLSRKGSRKSTKEKKEITKDTAVSKHLRVAHGVTGHSLTSKNEAQSKANMYTNARITHKVGLISTGRKGAPASRGLVIPEHISRQTEEEIRKMSAEAEADVHLTGDVDVAERLVLGSCDNMGKRVHTPASVEMRPALSTCNSVETLRNKQSPCDFDVGKFPEILPVKETVACLLTSLKFVAKSLYQGRDYLRETQDELLKVLKQNAPRSATPTRLPVFNKITKTGSVQRSLVESFTSDDSERHHTNYENRRPLEEVVRTDSRCKSDNKAGDNDEPDYTFSSQISFVPKINFAESNPFNYAVGKGSHLHLSTTCGSLSSLKRRRQQISKREGQGQRFGGCDGDLEKGKSVESLHTLYNSSRLLEYSRKKIQDEIRTFYDHRTISTSHDVKNSRLFVKEYPRKHVGDEIKKKVEKENYFYSKNKKFFSTPQSPVLESRKKIVTPMSPKLNWDPACMLQVNDENSQGTSNKDVFEPMEIDAKEAGAMNLLEQNDLLKERADVKFDYFDRPGSVNEYSSRTLEWVDQQTRSRSQCSHCSQESQEGDAHLQVPTRESNYMPSFHSNYYTDHMATGDLSWQQKNPRTKVEAMDILDYVDQCIGRDLRMDCRGDRTARVSDTSQDHDASAAWQPSHHVLTRRSLLPVTTTSPADGPRFYPKKMY